MKKGLALLAAAVLIFAACGKEGADSEDVIAGGQASASPSSTPKALKSAAPVKSAAPGAAKTAAPASARAAASSAPAAEPPQGGSNRPKDGDYVYNVEGTASDPFNPAAPPEKYSGTQTNSVSHSGEVFTTETTNSERPGRTTVRTRWTDERVTMLSLKSETAGGEFSCTFDPPLLITKFPVKPETYPKQELKGQGNACDGTLEITIVKKESVKDANARAWSTWQVKVKLTLKSDQFTITNNETRWVSPELGETISSDSTADGKFGPSTFKSTAKAALKKHP